MKRDFERLFEAAERQARPAVRRIRNRHRESQHAIIAANCNVGCRECGTDTTTLHVYDLVVYCPNCCPHCGPNGHGGHA